jgi:hypothetical protein
MYWERNYGNYQSKKIRGYCLESMNCQTLVRVKEHGFEVTPSGVTCAYSTLKVEPIEFLLQLALNTFKKYLEPQSVTATHLAFSVKTGKNCLTIGITAF